eukprot:CAMPEP_0184865858 /NCGR_PEP_ID=MMETSP0580-20130426/19446_1 /TAXON_ID=1118495 /ORGANISM="Dactyliosolen fragilissimus" /LENGTH=394 /DNA_ID=CAMNT_0027365233 /DNA_START=8 /DNA_END=1192 /DNA_ORIENTATION=-
MTAQECDTGPKNHGDKHENKHITYEDNSKLNENDDNDREDYFLGDLFTNTDYTRISIEVAIQQQTKRQAQQAQICDQQHHEDKNEQHDEHKMNIELLCSSAASTDYDLTGQIVWPVSIRLSSYLTSNQGRHLLQGRNVIEMGAGCGLPGIVASHWANQVILTDGNDTVVDLLQQNCATHTSTFLSPSTSCKETYSKQRLISATKMIWGNSQHVQNTLELMPSTSFDVVIAADVVQWPAVIEPLLHTVKALLWKSTIQYYEKKVQRTDVNEQHKQSKPTFVLGLVDRASSTTTLFFTTLINLGFVHRKVHPSEYLTHDEDNISNIEIPTSSRETGNTMDIYEITLSIGKTKEERQLLTPPRLLMNPSSSTGDDDDDVGQDLTLGKSYQQTLFLPY